MESTSAHDLDRRLADLVRSERHLVVQFVIELADFAKRELYRELGYTSLFYYCVRQLGLSKSSAFRRSEVARLIARFPPIAERLTQGQLSIRALVELREVLTEENHVGVLTRAVGMSQEQAQLLAVAYRPKPIPRDIVRVLPMPLASLAAVAVVSTETKPALGPPEAVEPLAVVGVGVAAVSAETKPAPRPPEVVKPLTPELRRLNVTVTADFVDELEQVRVALSHKFPDGNFEQVVREAFKLVLERDRKRKALTDRPRVLTDRPRAQPETPREPEASGDSETPIDPEMIAENHRYIPAAVRRAVWARDHARCTWPMGDGRVCGATHRLEFDHDLELALGGKSTVRNIRLLCRAHNLMKAEQHLGRAFMAKFRRDRSVGRGSS
jgi:5-methylcytosine-specific restriction endonuclease McrA